MEKLNGNVTFTNADKQIQKTLQKTELKPPIWDSEKVDMSTLYSDNELGRIIGKFPLSFILKSHKSPKEPLNHCYSMEYFPELSVITLKTKKDSSGVIIIDGDGKAVYSSCFWDENVDIDGDYSKIIKETKSRYNEQEKNNSGRLNSELDIMSALGRSQLK